MSAEASFYYLILYGWSRTVGTLALLVTDTKCMQWLTHNESGCTPVVLGSMPL
ncbi:hypothetical protein SAMN04515672_0411 [Natronorubrum texcoconense]|uniref:Uncharacterized protein n=1 Tax=Natronorubrum texcoconense TaxID=1095776 RepID=A0A1G8TCD9_9EURY|nr:hypothetical protein SAMN04515672_0411 [Natronorubrum texcoconense]